MKYPNHIDENGMYVSPHRQEMLGYNHNWPLVPEWMSRNLYSGRFMQYTLRDVFALRYRWVELARKLEIPYESLDAKQDTLRKRVADVLRTNDKSSEILNNQLKLWNELIDGIGLPRFGSCDLRGVDLRKMDFIANNGWQLHIQAIDLSFSACSDAIFAGADCRFANFGAADCADTSFIEADCRNADFSGALCIKAHFDNARCQDAYFAGANCADAFFIKCDCTSVRFDATVCRRAYFDKAICRGAHFDRADCTDAHFYSAICRRVYFENSCCVAAHFDGANCAGAKFNATNCRFASFDDAKLYGVHFIGAKLGGVSFSNDTHISTNTQFLPKKDSDISETKKMFPNLDNRKVRRMLADEYIPDAEGSVNYKAAYTAYLAVKNLLKNKGFYSEAGDFYYREMVCRRKEIRLNSFANFREWFWSWMRNATIGYGEKPMRLCFWFLATIMIFTIPFYMGGVFETVQSEHPVIVRDFAQALYASAITFATVGYGDVSPALWWVKLCACIEALLGLVLTALFVVAIVRKIIRD